MECPTHAFRYNGTQCCCNPGYFYNTTQNSCELFVVSDSGLEMSSGVHYDSPFTFPRMILPFNSISRFTASQAAFLEVTLVVLVIWLFFCLFLRFVPMGSDGRSTWFKIRWWVSRLDISFATRHWLDDQNTVIKRKTELGGSFSVASWITFIGLFAALLYQTISKQRVEVGNVRATNSPDLASFVNDFALDITTISSMNCAHLRGLGTLVTGNPMSIDSRVIPLSRFTNFSCINTTVGPTIALRCYNCKPLSDIAYISWQFVDLPNSPATAIAFQFNLTAMNPARNKIKSFVSGTLSNVSNQQGPVTYRGILPNMFKFNLFPVMFRNLHDLKLIQPLFHEFVPGSYFDDTSQLQASIGNPKAGLINNTLSLNFLSSYIIEIENQNTFRPVSFLADLGGLYCISIGIFFYLLIQCEYRFTSLRNEDNIMRNIKKRRRAQDNWDKLRKYVHYTRGCTLLDLDGSERDGECCACVTKKSFHQHRSSPNSKSHNRMGASTLSKKKDVPEHASSPGTMTGGLNLVKMSTSLEGKHAKKCEIKPATQICPQYPLIDYNDVPPIPPLEFSDGDEIRAVDLQENLKKLYEYNVQLRMMLVARQVIEPVRREKVQ